MNEQKSTFEEQIRKHGYLVYRNVGDSMLPILRQGKDLMVISRKPEDRLKKYDVPLYKRDNGQYVLHRILKVRKNDYIICGDNRTHIERNITVINGDKPLVRFSGGQAFAYGTPWAGKEGEQTNKRTPLKKICFIERSEKNECIKISASEALIRLLSYIYTDNGKYMEKALNMVDLLLKTAEFYVIRCNMDISAAKTACEVIME